MSGRDPKEPIEALRERLEAGKRGGSEADGEALLEASANIRLLRSKVGGYRHREIVLPGSPWR